MFEYEASSLDAARVSVVSLSCCVDVLSYYWNRGRKRADYIYKDIDKWVWVCGWEPYAVTAHPNLSNYIHLGVSPNGSV